MLSVKGVQKIYEVGSWLAGYQSLHAVRDVDISIDKGEIVGLVGESGCGKSTLMRLLLGVESPTRGEIEFHGRPISGYGRLERARLVQPVFQDPYSSLNPRQTVSAIIMAPLEVLGLGTRQEKKSKVGEMMDFVGIPQHMWHAYPGQLSGGQRQRVAIARALVSEPEILLCDEPTSALDISVQSQILNLIARLQEEMGTTIILVSHNLAVVNYLVERVLVMYLGQIVEEGSVDAIFAAPKHPYTRALLDAVLVPDGMKGLPRLTLGTEFPDPLNPPGGCAFHPRCPKVGQRCKQEEPVLNANGSTLSACHFPLISEDESTGAVVGLESSMFRGG